MTEENQTEITTKVSDQNNGRRQWGITFILISSISLIAIPVVIITAIVITVLLQPSFYTGILKNGRFITAFVQAKSWQTEKKVTEEIEKKLHLSMFTAELEEKKSRFDEIKNRYDRLSRNGELDSLNKQRNEVKDLDWWQLKKEFPDKDQFDKYREDELIKIGQKTAEIEEYQDQSRDQIKTAEKEMEKAQDEYNEALNLLEDKKNEAEKISEKHKSTLSNTLYEDLDIIEKPLSKILNTKLIDGTVRSEIEKLLHFFTSYETQIEHRNIFYRHDMDAEGLGRLALMVRLPEIIISLWVDDDTGSRKQHILSDILADEIRNLEDIQNRTMLTTIFKLSDTRLGEYFANNYLKDAGMTIEGGVIRISIPVLKGGTAETIASIINFLSWGQYASLAAAGVLILFCMYIFFSAVERRRKLALIKRLLIYPSVLVLAACGGLLLASRYIFSWYPDIVSDLSARSYAKHLSFTAAWHFIIPALIIFGIALICGLMIRKYFFTGIKTPGITD
ncbi:MAG: hypothetical protein JXN64_14250 [Spirochaetes bacterium]|nr:hypothetical protein [Spirochaetota bacterium]